MKIIIIDYGMGNIASVQNMIKNVGGDCVISSDPNVISDAGAIILPGVGAFDNAIIQLKKLELFDLIIRKITVEKVPFLGICLGMQLLFESSEEGSLPGLGVFKGSVTRFDVTKMPKGFKVPHMGWNVMKPLADNLLFNVKKFSEHRFYFVHSFHVNPLDKAIILAKCDYGYPFVCSVGKENIYAVQFHPEKSHKFGKSLFENFLRICNA